MSIEKLLWEEEEIGLAARILAKDVTSAELTEAAIARAERVNPEINAIAERLYDRARDKALSANTASPFAGVPFVVKDLDILMKDVPSHSGSRIAAHVPDINSVLADRQEAAGLVPILTATTPEFGLRLVTESKAFGVTRNPWNTAHVTGGSSGGPAAMVAAGVVPMAHAGDGGGSIRVPAACCGLVGLKPSRGRIPSSPHASETWFGMVVTHAVTRSVRDSAALLDATHGADGLAPYAARPPKGSFAQAAARDPGKLKIGVWRDTPLGLPVSTETMAALDTAAALARDGGHAIETVRLDYIGRDFLADFALLVSCATAGQLRKEAVRAGHSVIGEAERGTRIIARYGEMRSGGELYAALDRLSAAARRIIAETARYDAVLTPLISHPPVKCGAMDPKGADEWTEELLDRLRLTRLLALKPLFGQLMDKSLWSPHMGKHD